MNKSDLSVLERRIGYTFKDKSLLRTALTHSSFAYENGCEDNERMEFLGDSILGFIIAKKLYFGGGSEGEMTVKRIQTVSRQPLALAVERMGAFDFLRLGVGARKEKNISDKFKGNLFEAILGAIYVDSQSTDECEKFIDKHLDFQENLIDWKSELQEFVQARKVGAIVYRTEEVTGTLPVEFHATVTVGDAVMGDGYGFKKKEAEKDAARHALEFLKSKSSK